MVMQGKNTSKNTQPPSGPSGVSVPGTLMTNAELIARMRRASSAIYIAVEEAVAADISQMLTEAASRLEAVTQEK